MRTTLAFTMTQDGFPDLPDLSRLPLEVQFEASLIIGLRRARLTWAERTALRPSGKVS